MVALKNEADIIEIKKAVDIGEHILKVIKPLIKVGTIPIELDRKIEDMIINEYGALPSFKGFNNYPNATCISVNETIIHGIPNDRPFTKGDIVTVDVGINVNGYYSDQAKTYYVEEPNNDREYHLILDTNLALVLATEYAKVGFTIGDISYAIENTAKIYKLGILKRWAGHGVGFSQHEDPSVPNVVGLNKSMKLQKGMVIAIEPLFVLGNGDYRIDKNGFSVIVDGPSAHFEKTVIVE